MGGKERGGHIALAGQFWILEVIGTRLDFLMWDRAILYRENISLECPVWVRSSPLIRHDTLRAFTCPSRSEVVCFLLLTWLHSRPRIFCSWTLISQVLHDFLSTGLYKSPFFSPLFSIAKEIILQNKDFGLASIHSEKLFIT